MFLQPPAQTWSPWDIVNYRWSEPFIWIAAFASLIFAMILFASYVSTHKKQLLLWSFGFLGMWVFFHQMITTGTYTMMVVWDDTSMFGIPTEMLKVLVPGLFAAGLCFAKSVKFGKIASWYLAIMTVIYTVLQLDPSYGQIKNMDLYATIAFMLLTINVLVSLIAIFSPLHDATVDTIFKLMSFFILGAVIFLVLGIIGKEEYGFKLPYLKFAGDKESKESTVPT